MFFLKQGLPPLQGSTTHAPQVAPGSLAYSDECVREGGETPVARRPEPRRGAVGLGARLVWS